MANGWHLRWSPSSGAVRHPLPSAGLAISLGGPDRHFIREIHGSLYGRPLRAAERPRGWRMAHMTRQAGGITEQMARTGVTEREIEVLAAVAERLRNREIAERLHLSVRT